MTSMTEPEPAQQSNLELQMASLQSKHEALEAEFAALKDRLRAVETRLPPSGNETAPGGFDDARQPLESGHPAKGEDEPGCPDPNSSDQANDETIQRDPADIFRSVGREPEQFRRWKDRFLLGWKAPVHFSQNRWPDLGRSVTSFCQAAFPRHVPLDNIEKHDKDWISSWAPNTRCTCESTTVARRYTPSTKPASGVCFMRSFSPINVSGSGGKGPRQTSDPCFVICSVSAFSPLPPFFAPKAPISGVKKRPTHDEQAH
jgi:hypothetical protein